MKIGVVRTAFQGGRPQLVDLFARPPWMNDGLCAQTDPEIFYPEKGESNKAAKSVCLQCPVMLTCRQHSIDTREPYGVWGGLSARERQELYPDSATCVWCKESFDGNSWSRYCTQSCAQAAATGGRSEMGEAA